MEHATFTFGPGKTDGPPVLRDLTLAIRAGQLTCIVGPTVCGITVWDIRYQDPY
jgi:ABC-type multidrug transport system fused ATPase/permease subunit